MQAKFQVYQLELAQVRSAYQTSQQQVARLSQELGQIRSAHHTSQQQVVRLSEELAQKSQQIDSLQQHGENNFFS